MSDERPVRKAVIPVAGLGTRFLPATKAIPKEMLPVVDKPAIQYVVEEAVSAGLDNVLMVTGRNKGALEDHFDRHWELEQALEAKGDAFRLERVRAASVLGEIHYVRQGDPLGLGHAVLCAAQHVGDEPFAVLLGDDLIDVRDTLLETMLAVRAEHGGSVIALLEVPPDQAHLYGCAAIDADDQGADVVRVTGLVEKPAPEDAPSNLALIGRYVIDPAVFEVLRHTGPGRGGEIQLTDALQELAAMPPEDGGGVRGVVFRGRRYDTGDRLSYLQAVVQLAEGHPEFGEDFSSWAEVARVIGVEDHLARCLDAVQALDPIDLALLEAQDCVLAEDVVSPLDVPGFDNSAMDGYAVLSADVVGASAEHPVELPVVGDIPAGSTQPQHLAPGQTMRIMTGAPVPRGAQAVVPVEQSDGGVRTVLLSAGAPSGQHIRPAGGDVRAGEQVLSAGTLLGPAQLALLAAVGRARVKVHAQPRVVVLSTGSGFVDPGVMPGFGQVVDSNGIMLTAAAIDAGARPYRVGVVRDEAGTFLQTLTDQLVRADLVVTTGGVSAGAYDTVKEVLRGLGTVWFGKVAMQPGMPQGFGTVGPDATPIFTLPGNPVSSYVSFEMFVRPAIRKMAGHRGLFRRSETAVALDSWSSPAGKLQLARAELGTADDGSRVVRLSGAQGSHVLGGLARASALVVVPEAVTRVEEGDEVRCLVLDRRAR